MKNYASEAEELVSKFGLKSFSFGELKRVLTEIGFAIYDSNSEQSKKLMDFIGNDTDSKCFLYNNRGISVIFYDSEETDNFSKSFQLAMMLVLNGAEDSRKCTKRQLVDAAVTASYIHNALNGGNLKFSEVRFDKIKNVCLTIFAFLAVIAVIVLLIVNFIVGKDTKNPFNDTKSGISNENDEIIIKKSEKNNDDLLFQNNTWSEQQTKKDVSDTDIFQENEYIDEKTENESIAVGAMQTSPSTHVEENAVPYKEEDKSADMTHQNSTKEKNVVTEQISEKAEPVDNKEKFYYVTKSGKKYHVEGCRFVSNTSECKKISSSDPSLSNYEPCKVCVK